MLVNHYNTSDPDRHMFDAVNSGLDRFSWEGQFHRVVDFSLADGGVAPTYSQPGDAGMDLTTIESHTFTPASRKKILRTGVSVVIPQGCVGFVTPRSGLAAKHNLSILNAPGTIDSGYRGELMVIAFWHGDGTYYTVNEGDRVAQLVVVPYVQCKLIEIDDVAALETERGTGKFGSTGK